MPRGLFLISAVDVISPQVVVRGSLCEQMPDDLQDGVGHGNDGDLVAPVPTDPAGARGEGETLRPGGGERRLNQRYLQPAIPLAGPAPTALPHTLVVAGTEAGPVRQVPRRGEADHVHPDLRDDILHAHLLHPRGRLDAGDLRGKWGEAGPDLQAQRGDGEYGGVLEAGRQAVPEGEEVRGGGAESLDDLRALPGGARAADAGRDRGLVDIEARATLQDDVHGLLLLSALRGALGGETLLGALLAKGRGT